MKIKKNLLQLIIAGVLAGQVLTLSAQTTDVRVDGQKIYDLIKLMSRDESLGRKPLTPEFWELQDWAAEKFASWGLEPAGDNGTYFQAVPIESRRGGIAYSIAPGIPTLKIGGREFFSRYSDFTIDSRSAVNKKMKGEIIFAGYGISAPEKGLDEYVNIDVKGKFVFVFKGSPAKVEAPRLMFSSPVKEGKKADVEQWKTESTDSSKIYTAYNKGAAGIIFYNPETNDDPYARYRRRRSPLKKSDFTRDFMIVSNVDKKIVKWMFWTDDQVSSRAFDRKINKIRFRIKKGQAQSKKTGIKIEVKGFDEINYYGKQFGNGNCRNIIAMIPGTDPVLKKEYVIMGGHYDHLGVTNGQVYNGADDNATGSAVTMEIARLMKQHNIKLKRTVVFCLWTGEELGLIGSRYYTDNPTAGVSMDKVVTYFNMDMVGLGDRIGAPGALNFPTMWNIIKKDQLTDVIQAVDPETGGAGGSDHSGFITKGIEALALMTSGANGHPDYHDTGDDIDYIEPEILRKTGQFVLQGTINLGNEPESLIIPDRLDIFNATQWKIAMINPALKAEGSWSRLDAENKDELANLINEKIAELKKPADNKDPRAMYFRYYRSRSGFSKGLKGPVVFANDPVLLNIAKTALGFARLDVCGKDSLWFAAGLTECGRKGWKMAEANNLLITLNNPASDVLAAVLAYAEKPFLLTGMRELSGEAATAINKKSVVVTVDFNPADVAACFKQLDKLSKKFGDKDNILLNITSTEGLKEATVKLYMSLLKNGWTHEEIYAIGGAGANWRSKGNLDAFKSKKAGGRSGR